MSDTSRALSALNYLDSSCAREEWVRIGMAAKSTGLSFNDFHSWSQNAANYKGEKDCRNIWNSFSESGGITSATLFHMAREQGWSESARLHAKVIHSNKSNHTKSYTQNQIEKSKNINAYEIWERCLPAEQTHEYIMRKQGVPDGLRYYPEVEKPLLICGKDVRGYLATPCWSDDELLTLQFISPNKGDEKLNLTGSSFNDGYFTLGIIADRIYIVESIGNAWAINKSSDVASVVCFGASRMMKVAKVLRAKYPRTDLIIVPDRGKEKLASEIAIAVSGQSIELPQDKPENYDVNDYLLEHGKDALRDVLMRPITQMPLDVIFANELSENFIPPDEIVEGVLTAEDSSILYGDSNSGKTFFVIDMACAMALGIDWMGRKTESGLIIYLAAESPASVKRRLQAYQKHHGVRVMDFAIIQNPINLFDGDADTNAVIETIHMLEQKCEQKAQLIVGDTLARLSVGANENAGQDMGVVVRHIDRIRAECKAHFMLIHHSGKNAAAGARGWSGVRAAVDTEIEVTDSSAGRCAEITKQRDLNSKGVRIGFRLETVTLGVTKWKSPATSCVVLPTEAPKKQSGKRLSEIAGAIIEYLTNVKNGVKKSELVKHLTDRYSSSAIYRELQKLVDNDSVSDSFGYVRILVPIGAN